MVEQIQIQITLICLYMVVVMIMVMVNVVMYFHNRMTRRVSGARGASVKASSLGS